MKTLFLILLAGMISSAQSADFPFLKRIYPEFTRCKYAFTSSGQIEEKYLDIVKSTASRAGSKWQPLSQRDSHTLWEDYGYYAEHSETLIWNSVPKSRDLFYGVQNALIAKGASQTKFLNEDAFTLAVAAVHYQLGYTAAPEAVADLLIGHKLQDVIDVSDFQLADLREPDSFALDHARAKSSSFEVSKDFYLLSQEAKRAAQVVQDLRLNYFSNDGLVYGMTIEFNQIKQLSSLKEVVARVHRLYGALAYLRMTGKITEGFLRAILNETQYSLTKIVKRFEPNIKEINQYYNNFSSATIPMYNSATGELIRHEYSNTVKQLAYLSKFLYSYGTPLGVDRISTLY